MSSTVHRNHSTLVEVAPGAAPQRVDGAALDSDSLHDWLALPVQHFMDRHPGKSHQELANEVAEVVAELIASSTPNWKDARRMEHDVEQHLRDQVGRKFKAFARLRAEGMI